MTIQESIEIYPNVFLTQEQIDDCVRVRGSLVRVKMCIHQIESLPGRRKSPPAMVNAIKTWVIDSKLYDSNVKFAKFLCDEHAYSVDGWRCKLYDNRKQAIKCIVFYHKGMPKSDLYIDVWEYDFRAKCALELLRKGMQKSRISR